MNKTFLYILILLVVVAGGAWFLFSSDSEKQLAPGKGGDVYVSDRHGYALTLPADWEGRYEIGESDGSSTSFVFSAIPELRRSVFTITVYSQKEWETLAEEPGYHGTEIAKGNGVVFVYLVPLENPYEPYGMEVANEFQAMVGEVRSIVATFELGKQTDIWLARDALVSYFDLLNGKRYSEAIDYHGSGYNTLRGWNPGVDNNDQISLLRNGCEINGWQCLKIKEVLSQEEILTTEFKFMVQFANNNGTLFERGPCCGATEEEMPTETDFEYVVRKDGNGFKVVTSPVYVP